jgi:hypothetical protein
MALILLNEEFYIFTANKKRKRITKAAENKIVFESGTT